LSGTPSNFDNRNLIKEIFISEDEPRLRSGWRLLIQTTLMLAIGACVGFPLIFYLAMKESLEFDVNAIGKEVLLPLQIAEFIMFTSSIFLARRFLDKRSFTSLGLAVNSQAVWDVTTGVIVSFLMIGLIFVWQLSAGWIKIDGFAWETDSMANALKAVLAFLVIFALSGWNEELLFRGYHLQTIASGTNLAWGVVISSVIFSVLHLGNPSATWVSAIGIFPAGLLFAYAYIRSGQLWLPIGLHMGWNLCEGVIFGFPVSGLDIYQLLRIRVQGPALWTGGAFGPEAGLIVIPGLLLGTALVYIYTKTRQKTVM